MINANSLQALNKFRFNEQFQAPAYGSYCFAHIPDTVRRLFGIPAQTPLPEDTLPAWNGYQHLVFFFIDGFGWRFLQDEAANHPFIKELSANGLVSQTTSMFPSTTAAHTACIHAGLDVGASGIHEWFYYEPAVDRVIAPLLFSLAGEKSREQLVKMGYNSSQLIPQGQFYPDLSANGVSATVFNHQEYAFSSFSNQVCYGADVQGYLTIPEALQNIRLLMELNKYRPTYTFLYIPSFDSILHRYGPGSTQARAELFSILDQLSYFLQSIRRTPRTLLLFSADHGHSETDPATTIYINKEIPWLENACICNRSGAPIRFGGSPRDLFLYIQQDRISEVKEKLNQILAGSAEVYLTDDLANAGLFGPAGAGLALKSRLASLVILPYRGKSVYWYEKGVFEQEYYGHHGGLSPEEMLTPFIAYPLG